VGFFSITGSGFSDAFARNDGGSRLTLGNGGVGRLSVFKTQHASKSRVILLHAESPSNSNSEAPPPDGRVPNLK